MKRSVAGAAGALMMALMIFPAVAIETTPGGWRNAEVSVGRSVRDANDIVVKPCDCEAVADPGFFRAFQPNGGLAFIHYADVEGTEITTTDGTVVGMISSVQNENENGAIVLLVRLPEGLIGTVGLISVYRNAWYWTGSAAVINTTFDDLRASILRVGPGA